MEDGLYKKDEKLIKRARSYINRVKKQSASNNIELTEWEGEFLSSIDERLEKYGKAFNDPDLGAMNAPLSLRQGLKLKQIRKKSLGEEDAPPFKKAKSTLNKKPKTIKAKSALKAKTTLKRKSPLRTKIKTPTKIRG
ncbi:hypothetical protein [Pseudaquidulcibacter saccharophilus]|uniref:hypothetical protein n=1 Tax=Pseudaquidulcibacter saccharophilus TaxID=2831900 RepID=UPI001EFF1A4B|nr:hypothetical protein [Pseudaquidulcibacter saccharophilus]